MKTQVISCGKTEDRIWQDEDADVITVPYWSFTKTLIAASILRLVDQNKIGLDDPCPNTPGTIRQVLSHRSGIPDYGPVESYHKAVFDNDPPWSVRQLLKEAKADQPWLASDDAFAYSNIGYMRLKDLIELVTGSDWHLAMRDLINLPSAMQPALTADDFAKTSWAGTPPYDPGWVYHGLIIGPVTAARDWLHSFFTQPMLNPETLGEMRSCQSIGMTPPPGRPIKEPSYGLGLMSDLSRGNLGHNGGGPGSTFACYHFPNHPLKPTIAIAQSGSDEAAMEQQLFSVADKLI